MFGGSKILSISKVTVNLSVNTELIIWQYSECYIGYVHQGAFAFESEHGFGPSSGLKHCPLEYHGSQLEKKNREEHINNVKAKQETVNLGTKCYKKSCIFRRQQSVCVYIIHRLVAIL